jgi:hypothetical protein
LGRPYQYLLQQKIQKTHHTCPLMMVELLPKTIATCKRKGKLTLKKHDGFP